MKYLFQMPLRAYDILVVIMYFYLKFVKIDKYLFDKLILWKIYYLKI